MMRSMSIPVTIIRSPRERVSKCSLEPLRGRAELRFLWGQPELRFDGTGHVLLGLEGPVLSREDAGHPLLVLDSTWRLLPQLERLVVGDPIRRTLPAGIPTAYPRVSKLEPDPHGGLASVEALFVAKAILGEWDPTLLGGYHWREEFLNLLEEAGYSAPR